MSPTTEQVMSHVHADDAARMTAVLDQVRRTREPFNSRHRIVDILGDVHEVIVVGNRFSDRTGKIIGTRGFHVDVTPSAQQNQQMARERNQALTDAVADIAERRAVIEQAKGMLMLVYRIDSSTAFDLMRWRSQDTNVKLRTLARRLVDDVAALDAGDALPPRSTFDDLLLTAHERAALGGAS
jgi:ANTAR domain